jgi:hypothetical protein
MKIRTIIDDGGASLPSPVQTYTIPPETLGEHGTRHGCELEGACGSLSSVGALVTTITFDNEDVIQVFTWLGEFDPNETVEAHVARHVDRVVEVIVAWP